MLFAGDDQGFLNTFTLSVNEFWHVGTVESYIDLADFPNLTHGVKYDGEWIHDEWITQIKFYEDLDDLVTSSMDKTIAFVDLDRNRQIWNNGNKNGIKQDNNIKGRDPLKISSLTTQKIFAPSGILANIIYNPKGM